ncbi:MAG: MBL fold metallo-hydrolase, partial [Planctomycetota bacterium]
TTNAFVVGEDRLFVVDPAPEDATELARLEDLIDGRCSGGAEVVGVLLTHHHPDHVGGAERIAARYDAPVLAHEETLARLRARAAGFGVANARALGDGVALPLGVAPDGTPGWTLTAHFTPGHAPGHLAFRESRYGAVLAGDLVSTVSTIVIDPPEGHLATYLESLGKMRDTMGPGEVLHPAHGPVAAEGRRVLERYIEHRARREESLVAALANGLTDETALVARVYADVDERLLPIAARSLRAGLEKLADEARAVETAPARWAPAGG